MPVREAHIYLPTGSPCGVAREEAEGDGRRVVAEAADELELHVHHAQPQQLVLIKGVAGRGQWGWGGLSWV